MYLGIDLGGTNIKVGLFTTEFALLDKLYYPTDSTKGAAAVFENIFTAIETLLTRNQLDKKDLQVIGAGIPGLMDIQKGLSIFSPNFANWENVPVVDLLEKRYDCPAFIDNDVRVNLYGEWHFGAGKGKQNLVLLTLGTGLGSGVVMAGRVLYGATSSAGEIGHMNMFRTGRPCACGSQGCLGRYVSARGILKTFEEKAPMFPNSLLVKWQQEETLTTALISKAFDKGDALATEIYQETGELLGFGLTNIINLFNPEMIIIGGGVSKAGERLLGYARKIVTEHSLKIARENCEIRTATLSDEAGMIGAAYYGSEKLNEVTACFQ